MRFLRRSMVGLFLLAATLGILVVAGKTGYDAVQARLSDEPQRRPARERVFAVNVLTVTPESVTPELRIFGEIRSRRTLEIRATRGGRIVWLADAFQEGGRVEQGALLARIDPADAQSALSVAQSDLNKARADLAEAQRAVALSQDDLSGAEAQATLREQALTRQRDARTRGVGTDTAVETAELAAASAQQAVVSRRQALASALARVDQAQNALDRQQIMVAEAERGLANTEIFAGFSGTLGDVAVLQGGIVNNNERMAQLIDPDALEVVFRLSAGEYARLLDADGRLLPADVLVSMEVEGVDIVANGVIERESAAVGAGQTGRQIFARLDVPRGFRPGDFVAVTIRELPLDNVAAIPATAIASDGTVLVVGDEDRLEQVAVNVLRRQTEMSIVRAGPINGREVVTERTPLLGAGIRVRPLRQEGVEPPPSPEMIELSEERRARIVAFVEGNAFMPDDAKKRVLAQLQQARVPAQMIARIEARIGG